MKIDYTIHTQDFFGAVKEFRICWIVNILNRTFAIGIDLSIPNEISLFEVDFANKYNAYAYTIIDTLFWDVYQKNNFSIEDEIQKKIKEYLIQEHIRKSFNSRIKTF